MNNSADKTGDRGKDYKVLGVDQFSSTGEPQYISTGDLFDNGDDDEWSDYVEPSDEWDGFDDEE